MRGRHSVFWKAPLRPRNWRACAEQAACPRWRCSIATAFMVRRGFIWRREKCSMRAHIGAEVTSAAGWRYPLLVESRAGYQNLCRLITRMKLRAKKGEGSAGHEEVAERSGGLICLTGGAEGPLAHALTHGGIDSATECVEQLCRTFRAGECVRRTAAASFAR